MSTTVSAEQPELLANSSLSSSKAPAIIRPLRVLQPAMMWAELEHCRRLADESETPFTVLFCKSRQPIKLITLQNLFEDSLSEMVNSLGCIGLIDRNRLAFVINDVTCDRIEEVVERVDSILEKDAWHFSLHSYPFELRLPPDGSRFPYTAQLANESLQPFFALPTSWLKRAFDLIISVGALLVLLPLFIWAALLIKCSSAGPILFRQRRSGLGGVPFMMYKFRTMNNEAELQQSALRHLNEQDGPAFKIVNDPRVTGIGRFLRFSCIDELPQLLNVAKGDMSLVGPRPLPCDESDACRWWQRRRLDVAPGMTCTWQARGRQLVSFDEWMRMDLDYVRRRSLGFDIKILFSTVYFVFTRRAG